MSYELGRAWFGVGVVAALALGGCTKVAIDPKDPTPPTAVIKVKGADGQYTAQTTADMNPSSGQLDLMCIIDDPQGVRSVKLSYVGAPGPCVIGGAVTNNPVPINGLPAEASTVLQGDAGKVITSLPLLGTLKGALTCSISPPTQVGVPTGKVHVYCGGTNWQADPLKNGVGTELLVTLK